MTAENSTKPWKRFQSFPNDALIAHTKEGHIRPWFHRQKANKKDWGSRHTLSATNMEMPHDITIVLTDQTDWPNWFLKFTFSF